MEDYYSILGLDPGASHESIKLAYRRLAREHHPDRKINSTESEKEYFSAHMAQLNGAYAVLSDAKLRREYDVQNPEEQRSRATMSTRPWHRNSPNNFAPISWRAIKAFPGKRKTPGRV